MTHETQNDQARIVRTYACQADIPGSPIVQRERLTLGETVWLADPDGNAWPAVVTGICGDHATAQKDDNYNVLSFRQEWGWTWSASARDADALRWIFQGLTELRGDFQ